jgi:hypothetical protein
MNPRWLLIRRLRGPAFLLIFGVTALLNQFDILSFGRSWPLYLILAGALSLAERAALANVVPIPFNGGPGAGGSYTGPIPTPYQPPYASSPTSVVPYEPVGTQTGIEKNDPTTGGRS